MAALRTDAQLSRRIVSAFLDFISSVEAAPGVDLEGLDVVGDCLKQVFALSSSTTDGGIQPGLLVNLFTSWEGGEKRNSVLDLDLPVSRNTSSSSNPALMQNQGSSKSNGGYQLEDPKALGLKDELFGRFYSALDKINYFSNSPSGEEDPLLLRKATFLFNDTYNELESSGNQVHPNELADLFKSKGNQCVHQELYNEAVDLYTCAIAVCGSNAVYYCNRAACYMHTKSYTRATEDCLKAIEIDPNYGKAYRRLGDSYRAQGRLADALAKGYSKALQMDPNNQMVKEKIEVTRREIMEHVNQAARATTPSPGQESAGSFSDQTNRSCPFMNSESASWGCHNASNPAFINIRTNGLGETCGDLSDMLRMAMEMFPSQARPQDGPASHGGPGE